MRRRKLRQLGVRRVVEDQAQVTTQVAGCTISFASAPWLGLVVMDVEDDHRCQWYVYPGDVWRAVATEPGTYNIRVKMEVTIH